MYQIHDYGELQILLTLAAQISFSSLPKYKQKKGAEKPILKRNGYFFGYVNDAKESRLNSTQNHQ